MAKRDPLPPRGPNPIGSGQHYRLTANDKRFLRSLRIAQDDDTTRAGEPGEAVE